jgi:hypothetical protein
MLIIIIINLGYHMQLHKTSILAKNSRCMDQTITEAIKIELHPNISRENGFSMSRSWKPLIQDLMEW